MGSRNNSAAIMADAIAREVRDGWTDSGLRGYGKVTQKRGSMGHTLIERAKLYAPSRSEFRLVAGKCLHTATATYELAVVMK